MTRGSFGGAPLLVFCCVAAASCASGNTLHKYHYADRTLAVVSDVPAYPEVLSGPYFLGRRSGDPLRDLVRVGARVVREVEARAAEERLDSAVALVDLGYALEDKLLGRAARYLGADPTTNAEEPDFVLELMVIEYGIDAEEWEAAAHFFIEADASLLDEDSGHEIWRTEIRARDPIGPAIFGRRSGVRDIVTAAMLADLSVEEMVVALESLADFSARVITDQLRDDLRDARRR